jgi:putative (di)nucleoside polyphosphate hydrolase
MPVPVPDVIDAPKSTELASVSSPAPQAVTDSRPVLYRPNVAAILLNMENYMLVAQRSGLRSAWQFPQGGVDPGEGLEEALFREVEEEIGVTHEHIQLLDRKGGYRYDFPKGRLKYGIYGGQEQVYYLCRFLGKDRDINLDTEHREFDRWRWIKPEKFDMEWVPRFKRDVYRRVFKDFFGMEK